MAFVYSFSNVTVGNPDFRMTGFSNFAAVLGDPIFRKALLNTASSPSRPSAWCWCSRTSCLSC